MLFNNNNIITFMYNNKRNVPFLFATVRVHILIYVGMY